MSEFNFPQRFEYLPDKLDVARITADKRQELMENWSELEWGKRHAESLDYGYYSNQGENQELGRRFSGLLSINRAMDEQMSRDYMGGMFSDNIAAKQDIGADLSYLSRFDEGGMLDVGAAG